MSKRSQARRSLHAANNFLGGARSTKVQRKRAVYEFIEFCAMRHTPLMSVKEATLEQVKAFLDCKKSHFEGEKQKGLSTASLHNVLAAIRSSMRALKADPDAVGINAKNLGVPPRPRHGTKLPVTDEVFFRAVAIAEALGELGYAILLKIERYFGHRGQEALMSAVEVQKYAADLTDLIRIGQLDLAAPGGCVLPELRVLDGAKSGKSRVTAAIAKYARESLETMVQALRYLENHSFLVEGRQPGLKSARSKMQALARKCGLVGKYAPHSLRYRYAVDKLEELRDASWSAEDAFKLVTHFLGHGPSRTNAIIRQVYCQTVVSTFPKKRKRRDFAGELQVIEGLLKGAFPESLLINKPAKPANPV